MGNKDMEFKAYSRKLLIELDSIRGIVSSMADEHDRSNALSKIDGLIYDTMILRLKKRIL